VPAVYFISGANPEPSSGLLRENAQHLSSAYSLRLAVFRLTEIRAAQRTFEGAYMRTALSQFSFALIILKIFTSEFYAIGALFAAYGVAVLVVAIFRRYEGNKQFFDQEESDSESDDGDVGEQLLSQDGGVASPRGRRRVQMIRKKFRTSGNSGKWVSINQVRAVSCAPSRQRA